MNESGASRWDLRIMGRGLGTGSGPASLAEGTFWTSDLYSVRIYLFLLNVKRSPYAV